MNLTFSKQFLNISIFATMAIHPQSTRLGSVFRAVGFVAVLCSCGALVTRDGREEDPQPFCLRMGSDHGRSQVRFLTRPSPLSVSLLTGDATHRRQRDARGGRRRRALILPGTLWCGRGTSANNYEQLGMFEHADRCCREHDHCEHIIRAFSVNFGVFNPTLFTVSHCDCDHRFKQCLLNGNDTISNMVGYSFFNVLKLRCFELSHRKRCTHFNWFGMCTSVQVAPVAVLKDSTPYNSTNHSNEKSDSTDPSCNEVLIESSHNGKQRPSKSKQSSLHEGQRDCAPVKHAKGSTFQPSQKLVKKYTKKKKIQTAEPQKGRKIVQPNSFTTFTLRPQTDTSIEKQRTSLKLQLETVLQSIERNTKASVTHSPPSASESKSLWIQKTVKTQSEQTTQSKARTLRRKKNKVITQGRRAVKLRQTKKKCKPKNSYGPFQPSRGDNYQPKPHRGKKSYFQRTRCPHST